MDRQSHTSLSATTMQKIASQNSSPFRIRWQPLLLFSALLVAGGFLLLRVASVPNLSSNTGGFDDLNTFDTPDAVTKEVPSPDGNWVGVLIYSVGQDGKTGRDLFALRPKAGTLERNAEGGILSTLYAGKNGTEIQKAEWRNSQTVLLTLRHPTDPLPPDRVLARFRGIVVKGEISTQ